jgi:hypothetical protein
MFTPASVTRSPSPVATTMITTTVAHELPLRTGLRRSTSPTRRSTRASDAAARSAIAQIETVAIGTPFAARNESWA